MNFIIKLRMKIYLFFLRHTSFLKPVHYIGGSETLPPPLSKEEESRLLLKLASDGAAVRKTLIEHNLRLVVYIAKKFENTGVCIEDLISIGSIGLIKAINTFNPEKNIKLATYASRCIENEILMFLRKNISVKSEVSIDEPLNVDWDGNELLLSDSKREKQIIIMRFGLFGKNEKTQREVAELLGISQSYISRLEKRIVAKLKKEVAKIS